jgi:hypothetical protein
MEHLHGQQSGKASGFFAWEESDDQLIFQIVTSRGVVINQRQTNHSDHRFEMDVHTNNGERARFPPHFKVLIQFDDETHYHPQVLLEDENGKWQPAMENRFTRVGQPYLFTMQMGTASIRPQFVTKNIYLHPPVVIICFCFSTLN